MSSDPNSRNLSSVDDLNRVIQTLERANRLEIRLAEVRKSDPGATITSYRDNGIFLGWKNDPEDKRTAEDKEKSHPDHQPFSIRPSRKKQLIEWEKQSAAMHAAQELIKFPEKGE